ncbi:MAG: hypothetical protein ABI240_14290, partial [Sphingomonas sp.]
IGIHQTTSVAEANGLPEAMLADVQPASNCAQTLPNLQRCVTTAAWSAQRTGDTAALTIIADTLRSGVEKERGPALYYRTYWLAYTDYLLASFALGKKKLDQVNATTLEADALLVKLSNKDQETYALQDLVLLLRFAVTSPTEMGPLLTKTSELRSILAKTTSIRGLYALALADYYTPKQYGGGRVAEGLLRQALETPEEPPSPLKPTWGRDDCAALLVQILRQRGANDEATSLYQQWHQKYPDSIALASVAATSK